MYGYDPIRSSVLFDDLLAFCRKAEADGIGGPVASGAVIASAVGAWSIAKGKDEEPLTAVVMGKPGSRYQPVWHGGCPKTLYGIATLRRIVMVDDIVSTGEAMIHAISELATCGFSGTKVVGIVTTVSFSSNGKAALMNKVGNIPMCVWRQGQGVIGI